MTEIKTLVSRVFATRNAAHLIHWRTPSYASHVAIGSFYGDIVDSIDSIVEMYQGRRGLIGDVALGVLPPTSVDAFVVHLTAEADWIANNRSKIAAGIPALENEVDTLAGLYLSTIYKLKFLS